jgi:ABC-type dipeptide/oligopeptide/nickel transport system permease component
VVVEGLDLIIGVIYLTANLVVDVSYGYLDPRVRPH